MEEGGYSKERHSCGTLNKLPAFDTPYNMFYVFLHDIL